MIKKNPKIFNQVTDNHSKVNGITLLFVSAGGDSLQRTDRPYLYGKKILRLINQDADIVTVHTDLHIPF